MDTQPKHRLQSDLLSQKAALKTLKKTAVTIQSLLPGAPHTEAESFRSAYKQCDVLEARFTSFEDMISKCQSNADTIAAGFYGRKTFRMLASFSGTVEETYSRLTERQKKILDEKLDRSVPVQSAEEDGDTQV